MCITINCLKIEKQDKKLVITPTRDNHHGKTVEGKGEKWLENGEVLPFKQHTPITTKGTLQGNKLHFVYTLYGTERATVSDFYLTFSDDFRRFAGTFTCTGANSCGSVTGGRIDSD